MKRSFVTPLVGVFGFCFAESLRAAQPVAQPVAQQLNMNPFLNLLALALIIERLIEIVLILIPGIEEKKIKLYDDILKYAVLQLTIQRCTLVVGMALGVFFCMFFRFGILDEVFPGQAQPDHWLNLVVTGLIAGSGSEPVHQIIQTLLSLREKLSASYRAQKLRGRSE
ncbi:hypothetical protein JW992_13005 [candidate division KSB1 bacterium]|nr:hypothetical protein [candidate division KSB1 bacterium]